MIEIINIHRLTGSGTVKAFVDFSIAEKMVIYGAKIIQQPGQRAWVAMPDRAYQVDGETRYAPVVKIEDGGLKEKITSAILGAWGNQHSLFRGEAK